LLNELNEVQRILNGKRINKKYTYRSYYLLAKYFKEQGLDAVSIRHKIFEWANQNNVYVDEYLNDIIKKAFDDKKELAKDIEINISQEDINYINDRFDKYNTKLIAFAFLCYAKVHINSKSEFNINMMDFSEWIGIHLNNIYKRYLPEIELMNFIERVSVNNYLHKKKKSKITTFKIKVKIRNEGNNIFYDKDLKKEFEKIMLIMDTKYDSIE
jgi:hypothetical protein